TMLMYLNGGFAGGETGIHCRTPLRVVPAKGMALLFRHHLLHEGAPVIKGRKYVLRTDVMYRLHGRGGGRGGGWAARARAGGGGGSDGAGCGRPGPDGGVSWKGRDTRGLFHGPERIHPQQERVDGGRT